MDIAASAGCGTADGDAALQATIMENARSGFCSPYCTLLSSFALEKSAVGDILLTATDASAKVVLLDLAFVTNKYIYEYRTAFDNEFTSISSVCPH